MNDPIKRTSKHVSAQLDYTFDWSKWLALDGTDDTIVSATVSISGDDAVLTNPSTAVGATSVRVWLAAGTEGVTYTVTCSIVSANSPAREDARSFTLTVVEDL